MVTLRSVDRFFLFFGLMLLAHSALTQVTLDGTLGPAGPLSGPNYAIPAEVGQQHGGNLFHSFGQFSIHQGESATFSGPNSVNNIIGRVTGGQVSTIDGLLRSTIPGANLYLLNPAGLLFGPNATLDVSGSFHASTADYLRLGEGGRFGALNPGSSVLTVAPVEAFGFLGDAPGQIAINGSYLHGAEGQTLSLVGGDINLENATLFFPAGRINMATVRSAGEVIPAESSLDVTGFSQLGTLTINRNVPPISWSDSIILGDITTSDVVSNSGSGAIFIRAEQMALAGGLILANTFGLEGGLGIDIQVPGEMFLSHGAYIFSGAFGDGDASNLNINAGQLELTEGSSIQSSTASNGNAGDINLNVAQLSVTGASWINSGTGMLLETGPIGGKGQGGNLNINATQGVYIAGQNTNGHSGIGSVSIDPATGHAGTVKITTPQLILEDGSVIDSSTNSIGDAGNIILNIDQLFLSGGSQIGVGTWSTGFGGNLMIIAGDKIDVSGTNSDGTTSSGLYANAAPGSTGDAGDLNLTTNRLNVVDGGEIGTATWSTGQGGNLTIDANEINVIGQGVNGNISNISAGALQNSTGNAGTLHVTTNILNLQEGGRIDNSTSGIGDAGNIILDVGQLRLSDGGLVGSTTFNAGEGGVIAITAYDLIDIVGFGLQDSSGLYASALDTSNEAGSAGMIVVNSPVLTIGDRGMIASNTSGPGNAGSITLDVGQLSLANGGSIQSATVSDGNAGQIDLNVGRLNVTGASWISATTGFPSETGGVGGQGQGGDLIIDATESIYIAGSASAIGASSFAPATGHAGEIRITTPHLIVEDSGRIENNTYGFGNAGSITLDVGQLSLANQGSVQSATFSDGHAGQIDLNVGQLSMTGASWISSATGFSSETGGMGGQGQGGNLIINATEGIYIVGSAMGASSFAPATGHAGEIRITTPYLILEDGGFIDNSTTGLGNAGKIVVDAGQLNLSRRSAITTNTFGSGNAGLIDIQTDYLGLTARGVISSGTLGENASGDGGYIQINVRESMWVTGQDSGEYSGIYARSRSGSMGLAGNITLTTPSLTLTDGGTITAASELTSGGNLLISADHIKLLDGGNITTSVFGAPDTRGGNVTLNSTNVVALNGSTVTAQANEGIGGNITVNAEVFLHDAPNKNMVLNASSKTLGNDGTVQVNAPTTDISGSLANLNTPYLDVSSQINPRCGGDRDERSHFLIHGRGTLPFGPDEASSVSAGRCLPPLSTSSSAPLPAQVAPTTPIYPATLAGFNNR